MTRRQTFRKEFYIEPPEIAEMTDEELQILRNDLDGIKIRVRGFMQCRNNVLWTKLTCAPGRATVLRCLWQGQNCPKPIRKWTQCGLNMRMYVAAPQRTSAQPMP